MLVGLLLPLTKVFQSVFLQFVVLSFPVATLGVATKDRTKGAIWFPVFLGVWSFGERTPAVSPRLGDPTVKGMGRWVHHRRENTPIKVR